MRLLSLVLILFVLLCILFNSCENAVKSGSDQFNHSPDIIEFLFFPNPPLDLSIDSMVEIRVVAADPDGDEITYNWESNFGELRNPVGSSDNLTVLQVNSTGIYQVCCFISDGEFSATDSVLIEVMDTRYALPESQLTFTGQIKLLFKQKCGSDNGCHVSLNTGGPPARKLDLTIYQSTITHLIDGSEPAIIPGQGEQSFLYKILFGPLLGRHQMPKNKPPLNSNERNGIKIWIDEGAPE